MELNYHWIQCKEGYYTKLNRSNVKSIILHSTDGRKGGDIPVLTGQTSRKVSVHWYTTREGEIYHFVQDSDAAYHAGKTIDPSKYDNEYSIGIEQEHFDDNHENWPEVQVRATALVVAYLRQKYKYAIPVKSHASIAAPLGRKVDPVDYPWDDLSKYVAEYMKETIVPKGI